MMANSTQLIPVKRPIASIHLHDLPYDILVKVVQEYSLTPHDVLIIAQVSRRLNSFITSSHFASRGSPDPRHSLTITMDRIPDPKTRIGPRYVKNPPVHPDDIDFLRYSLDLSGVTIEQLICRFDENNEGLLKTQHSGIADTIFAHHRELTRLILTRFSSVCSIVLVLEPRNVFSIVFAGYSTWSQWCHPFHLLLNNCINKGVTHFEIWGGSWAFYDARVRFSPWPFGITFPDLFHRTFVHSRRAIRAGPGWQVLSSPSIQGDPATSWNRLSGYGLRLNPLGPRTFAKAPLTTLRISSPSILLPPISNWTYQLVGTTPTLTTLIIHRVVQLDDSLWRVTLSWLRQAIRLQNSVQVLAVTECENVPTEPLLHLVRGMSKCLVDLTLLCPVTPALDPDLDRIQFGKSQLRAKMKLPNLESIWTTQEMLWPFARMVDQDERREWTNKDIRVVLDQLRVGCPKLGRIVVEGIGTVVCD